MLGPHWRWGRAHGWILYALAASGLARKCSEPGEDCRETRCCTNQLTTCFKKNKFWAGCKESCTPGIDPLDPPQSQTPWSCKALPFREDEDDDEKEDDEDDDSSDDGSNDEEEDDDGSADLLAVQDLPELPELTPSGLSLSPPPSAEECNTGVTKGVLGISGLDEATYAAGGGGKVRNPGIYMGHNSGFSVLRTCANKYKPSTMALFRVLGGEIAFTVDLSRVGCACNLAFYFISAPARGRSGRYNPGPQGDYYCDANKVQDQWCPEIDIMEANNRVFAATPHKCDEPSLLGHYSQCDRSGKGQSTRDTPDAYGPGSDYKINTEKPFRVTTAFLSDDGETLTGMTTTLSQDDAELVLDHSNCDPDYYAKLSDALRDGMAIRMSYWGSKPKTMSWLDEPPCSDTAACSGKNAGFAIISHIAVKGSLAPPLIDERPTPEVTTPMFVLPTLPPLVQTTEYPFVWPVPEAEAEAEAEAEWGPEPEYTFTEAPTFIPEPAFAASPTAQPAPAPAPVLMQRQPARCSLKSWMPWNKCEQQAQPVAPRDAGQKRFHLSRKMALAASIAAVSGAALLVAAFAPCFRVGGLPPGMLHQLQGPSPMGQYHLGEPSTGFHGGEFSAAPFPGMGPSRTPGLPSSGEMLTGHVIRT